MTFPKVHTEKVLYSSSSSSSSSTHSPSSKAVFNGHSISKKKDKPSSLKRTFSNSTSSSSSRPGKKAKRSFNHIDTSLSQSTSSSAFRPIGPSLSQSASSSQPAFSCVKEAMLMLRTPVGYRPVSGLDFGSMLVTRFPKIPPTTVITLPIPSTTIPSNPEQPRCIAMFRKRLNSHADLSSINKDVPPSFFKQHKASIQKMSMSTMAMTTLNVIKGTYYLKQSARITHLVLSNPDYNEYNIQNSNFLCLTNAHSFLTTPSYGKIKKMLFINHNKTPLFSGKRGVCNFTLLPRFSIIYNSIEGILDFQKHSSITSEQLHSFRSHFFKIIGASLRGIMFNNCTKIKDDAITHFKGHTNITSLNFNGCRQLTDSVIFNLQKLKLPHLKNVTLSNCPQITHFSRLQHLPSLACLHLSNCKIKDSESSFLTRLVHLRCLDLSGAPISDKTLVHLKNLKLVNLNLAACMNITNIGMQIISNIHSLRDLNIFNCRKITQAAWKYLEKLPLSNLRHSLPIPSFGHSIPLASSEPREMKKQ